MRNWENLNKDDAYKMNMAEFKGQTIQALQDIKENQTRLQNSIIEVQNQVNSQKLIAAIMGGISGIVTALFNPFKK